MARPAALAGGDTNSGQQVQVQPHAAGSEDNLLILGKIVSLQVLGVCINHSFCASKATLESLVSVNQTS